MAMDDSMRSCAVVLSVSLILAAMAAPAAAAARSQSPNQLTGKLVRVERDLLAACRWAQAKSDDALRSRAEALWRQRNRIVGQLTRERAERISRLTPACRMRLARVMRGTSTAAAPVSAPDVHWRFGSRGPSAWRYGHSARPPVVASPPSESPRTEDVGLRPGPDAQPSMPRPPIVATIEAPAPPEISDLFPWPPPTPSTRRSFSPDVLVDGPSAATLGDNASRLEGLLRRAEFDSWGYFRAPGGFALVTRVERLDGETGKQLAGDQRWSDRVAYASISPGAILSAIFATSRPRGYYRVFVFLVTDDPPMTRPAGAAETFATASRWAMFGRSSLPNAIRTQPVTANHELIVLVYEFEKVQGGETTHYSPSRWSLDHHLETLGLSFKQRP